MQADGRPSSGRWVRLVAANAALLIVGASVVVTTVVLPASPVAAASVSIGAIQGQMADHLGQDNGTVGNCITYAPPGTSLSSAFVVSPAEALTAHGRSGSNCPATLNTSEQSAVGFRPSAVTSVQDGTPFLIGRMVHYNNPIQANDRYFTGKLIASLTGFTAPNTLSFSWSLDETPNTGGGGCCNDLISFTNQISNITLTQGGLTFNLVMLGFVPVASGLACPATPAGGVKNEFSTVEGQQTHACLYATVVQVRSLTVIKQTIGGPARTFGFTSSSSLAGSPWANGTFNLASGASVTKSLTSGESVTLTEVDPADDRWALTNLVCTEIGAGGAAQPVAGATINLAARQVVLTNVPPPPLPSQPGITCTFTNTYTPKATLTLVKQVTSGSAAPSLWTLTATGSAAPPPSGTQVSGPSDSAAVTTQRVPAGTYALTERGTGAAETGYVQVGDWACRTAGGTTVAVTAGSVTLPDSAAATTASDVTCTVSNRLATGSLRIVKVVDAPAGAFTGGTGKAFTGTYDCGSGFTGTFSATIATPASITGIPAGRSCSVVENPPSGGLANACRTRGGRRPTPPSR